MSQENVKIVHRLVEAWNEGNVETFLGFFDHDCEVTFPPEVPEPGPFRGHAELRQWAEGFMAAWQSHHVEVLETRAARDAVVVSLHLAGRGGGSGIEMEETDAHLFTFRKGRIARWQGFVDHAEALEAVGLRETRAMSHNVDLVRRAWAAWEGGDLSAAIEALSPEMVTFVAPPIPVAGTYLGPEGFLQVTIDWAEGFDDLVMTGEEFIDAGDKVVVRSLHRSQGAQSGVPVQTEVWYVFTLRAGSATRADIFIDRSEAWKVAGLPE